MNRKANQPPPTPPKGGESEKEEKKKTMKTETYQESINHPSFGGAGGRLIYV